jgi:hypothetical protein
VLSPRQAPWVVAATAALIGPIAACGDPAAQVTLAPVVIGASTCGRPSAATGLVITAYGDEPEVARAVPLDGAFALAGLPSGTRQLGVAVLAGGAAVAIGKTAPLDFLGLADGARLPVMMAPPDGFCPVGAMSEPRVGPLLAPAGDGVLVVGGVGPAGPLSTAEYFDPATGAFTIVDVPEVLATADGFAGAALIPLLDGRVALSKQALAIFDPATRTFGEPVLIDYRAFHVGVALDAKRLLLAGGCTGVSAGGCAQPVRRSSKIYRLDALGTPTVGPTLTAAMVGATIVDEGLGRDGHRTYLVAGGRGDPGVGSRLDLDASTADAVTGLAAVPTMLDGGALLSAFAPGGAPASGHASILAPGAAAATATSDAPTLDGVTLVTLEDGSVVGLGGAVDGRLLRYQPGADSWSLVVAAGEPPPPMTSPAALRLADGSVLVLGGGAPAGPSASAWIYRPSLVGPYTGSVVAIPSGGPDATGDGALTPSDPAAVVRGTTWRLRATVDDDGAGGRALVGGPRMIEGAVTAVVQVGRGGVALVAAQTAPGEALLGVLRGDGPARIVRQHAGALTTLCAGATATLPADRAATVALTVRAGRAALRVGEVELVGCAVPAADRGAWGVAAVGLGADVTISTVTVER